MTARRRDPFTVVPHLRLALLSLAVLIFGFGGWAAFGTISGAVVAPGQLQVERDRQVVQHFDGGVVADIMVEEGARVAAGDVLMRLDGAQLRSELSMVETRLFEIRARRARLQAERDGRETITFPPQLRRARAQHPELADQIASQMDGQRQLLAARRATTQGTIAQLENRRAQIATQIEGITAQLEATRRQLELVARERDTQADLLERGLAQAARVLSLDREAARLEGARGSLLSERASAAERRAEIEQQILSLRAQQREDAQRELRDLSATELELAERRRALSERIERLELRAPVAGVVYGLQVSTPRAVLRPADPALYIVPQDQPLVITAQVRPSDIDQVRTGQNAIVMFPGLDTRDLPQLGAQVVQVSADTFTEESRGRSYYRVRLELQQDTVAALGDRALLPGMPVEVFLQTGARTPLQYLTRPLTTYFNRALREG